MQLTVIGTGYVGLVTGVCFADMGNQVVGVDIDEQKVRKLSSGELTIYEPGLAVPFERGLRRGRLTFTTDLRDAVANSDVVFLTLPTPPDEDGSADLSHVLAAAADVARCLSGFTVVVSKSTVPVGTCDRLREVIDRHKPADADFEIVSNPEFLREGVAVDDFMKPSRVVIGSHSERATEIMTRLYEPFVRSGNPILVMDLRSAELTKYAANALLATKISFMNEVANLCDRLGANVDQVRRGIGSDERIGKHFLYAGIGYGGSCFPKDVSALNRIAEEEDYQFRILRAVSEVNNLQVAAFADQLIDHFGGSLDGRRVAVWGLAFKPNTDDIREARSLVLIERILDAGASVSAFDPEAMANTRELLGDRLGYAEHAYDALTAADALVVCTEWNEFRRPDFERMRGLMAGRTVFDGRNIFDAGEMADNGFEYRSIGRPSPKSTVTSS